MGSYRHLCCIYSRLRLVPFASLRGRIYFFNAIVLFSFLFFTVQAWLGYLTKPCRFWHGQTSNPKGKPGTSWRLLRRLIGENLFHAVCQRWGSCGSSILNRSPPCNPNWDCFFDVISRVRKSFRAGGRALHYFICFRPEIFGLFLSARMNL
jgi:disulfide bond formation protein DsbB